MSSSSNPLLEFCLDGGNLKAINDVDFETQDPLLQVCKDFNDSSATTDLKGKLHHLGQIGCDINVRNAKGNTALHLLIKGNKIYKKQYLKGANGKGLSVLPNKVGNC